MFNRKVGVPAFLAVFGIGVFVGWFAKENGPRHKIDSLSTSVSSSVNNSSEPMGVVVDSQTGSAGSKASNPTIVASVSPPELVQDSAQAKAQIAMDEMKLLEERIKQDPFNTDLINEVGALVERYLSASQRAWGDIPTLVYMADKHPLLLQRSLDYMTQDLSQQGAPEKYDRFVRGLGLNEEYRGAERYMLSKVKSGEPIDQWFAWTEVFNSRNSLQLNETSEYMLSLLPSLTDSAEVRIAIEGVVGPEALPFNDKLSVSDKERFQRLLTPMFDSEDEKLREKAISTLGLVARRDSDKLLIKGMNDPSLIVREISYFHFYNNEIHNRDVADVLLSRVNDVSFEFDERELALGALTSNNRIQDLDHVIRDLQEQFEQTAASHHGG